MFHFHVQLTLAVIRLDSDQNYLLDILLKEICDGLNLPFYETMALWMVWTVCGQLESILSYKFLVFSGCEMWTIVTYDFLRNT